MTRERIETRAQLDQYIDDFREWANFPCNRPGNLKEADATRARMLQTIRDAQQRLKGQD